MARPRQPIEVMMGKRRVHRSSEEITERAENEIKADTDAIFPPAFLTGVQKREFKKIAAALKKLKLMTNLDCVCLAQYVASKDEWVYYTSLLGKLSKSGEKEGLHDPTELLQSIVMLEKLTGLQDKAFKRCRACAGDLGLTITSRCRLSLPKTAEEKKDDFGGLFGDAI